MGTGEFTVGSNPAMGKHPIQGGSRLLLVASCFRNRDKLWPDGPLGSHHRLYLPYLIYMQAHGCHLNYFFYQIFFVVG